MHGWRDRKRRNRCGRRSKKNRACMRSLPARKKSCLVNFVDTFGGSSARGFPAPFFQFLDGHSLIRMRSVSRHFVIKVDYYARTVFYSRLMVRMAGRTWAGAITPYTAAKADALLRGTVACSTCSAPILLDPAVASRRWASLLHQHEPSCSACAATSGCDAGIRDHLDKSVVDCIRTTAGHTVTIATASRAAAARAPDGKVVYGAGLSHKLQAKIEFSAYLRASPLFRVFAPNGVRGVKLVALN